jgi:hypothetical protein
MKVESDFADANPAKRGLHEARGATERDDADHRQGSGERLVVEAVWHVDHHAVDGEPTGLGCGSAGSGQLGETDGRGLREAVGPVVERAAVYAVCGAPLAERMLRRAPVGEQLRGIVLGDAAAGLGHGDLRPARSRVVGRGGPPCFWGTYSEPLQHRQGADHGAWAHLVRIAR